MTNSTARRGTPLEIILIGKRLGDVLCSTPVILIAELPILVEPLKDEDIVHHLASAKHHVKVCPYNGEPMKCRILIDLEEAGE